MMDAFFYQGDVPEAETLLDMAREALVACEVKDDLDDDLCKVMVDGLVRAWCAAREHESGEDDYDEASFDSAGDAESAYQKAFKPHYRAVVKRAFPKFDPDDDGMAWWPSGMTHRHGWPVAFVKAVATTLGRVEGAHSVAMYREMQRLDEARKAAEKKAAGAGQ